jgi:hypothetical protein
MQNHKESDMYEPVKQLLLTQGFVVRGEVKGCDVTAVKGDDLWIVEMKLQFNMTLLFQAMERLKATDFVFVAIPRPKRANDKKYLVTQKVLTKLEIGLITVALDSPTLNTEIVLFPGGKNANRSNKKSSRIKYEAQNRISDTTGGVTKQQISTAYRERCIKIACVIEAKGAQRSRDFPRDSSILRNNFYGWFKKTDDGSFELTAKGKKYLFENEDSATVTYYRMKANDVL